MWKKCNEVFFNNKEHILLFTWYDNPLMYGSLFLQIILQLQIIQLEMNNLQHLIYF
jgi:hypothetical protein